MQCNVLWCSETATGTDLAIKTTFVGIGLHYLMSLQLYIVCVGPL